MSERGPATLCAPAISSMSIEESLAHLARDDGTWVDARVERNDTEIILHPIDGSPPATLPVDTPLLLVNNLPEEGAEDMTSLCLLYTSPSPRDS